MFTSRELDARFAGTGRVMRWFEGKWGIYDMPTVPMNCNIIHECDIADSDTGKPHGLAAGLPCTECTNCHVPVPDHVQALYHLYETMGRGERNGG